MASKKKKTKKAKKKTTQKTAARAAKKAKKKTARIGRPKLATAIALNQKGQVRFTDAEYKAVCTLAKEDGYSGFSEWARGVIVRRINADERTRFGIPADAHK